MMPLRTQPSLNRDFTLLTVFIGFILLLVSGWVVKESIDTYHRDAVKQMESEAVRLDRALIVEIENGAYILESIGRQIQATGPEKQESISQLFFSFAKTTAPKRGYFSWVTKQQRLTVSSNLGVLREPIDVSDRDYVKKSIAEPWKVHIGRPIEGRLSQKWVIPMSLGLTDSNGTYVGTVVIALDTEILTDDMSRTLKDADMHFAITNTALTLITRNAPSSDFFSRTFQMERLQTLDFDKDGSGEYITGSPFSLSRHYGYYERSSQYPYIIFMGITPEKSAQALRAAMMPRLFQLMVIAVFLLFVLYSVRARIIQPVIALTQKTSRIVRGEGFDHSTVTGPLEIEQLSAEIKRLYDYLTERQRVEAELRIKNTELNRIKDAAQVTNRVKADFFAYVGAELTEPVEVILEQIETIKEQHFGALGNPLYSQHAFEVYEHAQQLLAMLGDMKAISEAETGLLALTESPLDVGFVLQKVVRIFRDKTSGAHEIQLDIAPNLPQLNADELRLKQLLLNILTSTVRHLSAGDGIRIMAAVKAQEMVLGISYIAQGAQQKTLGTLAASSAARSKHGLEMALARLLVAMHQGTLDMKTTQDRTTTITVKFPAIRVL